MALDMYTTTGNPNFPKGFKFFLWLLRIPIG